MHRDRVKPKRGACRCIITIIAAFGSLPSSKEPWGAYMGLPSGGIQKVLERVPFLGTGSQARVVVVWLLNPRC